MSSRLSRYLVSRCVVSMMLVLSLACQPKTLPGQGAAIADDQDIQAVTVLKGWNSLIRKPVREIVRDSIRWRVIRDSLYGYRDPGAEPRVDFGRQMLIVAIGPGGPPGDSIRIRKVSRTNGIQVTAVYYKECAALQEVTMPFHVVRIPRSQGQATFDEKVHMRKGPCA